MTTDALDRLGILVGTWAVEAVVPGAPTGTATIEWALGHRFLEWRVTIPEPQFPDSLAVISVNTDGATYTQHYFDARGTVRLYRMTLEAGRWILVRDEPDFGPLEFSQRFVGTVAPDGQTITGVWESSSADRAHDEEWRKDFELVYRRVA